MTFVCFYPTLERFVAIYIIVEVKDFLPELLAAPIECPGVMALTADVYADD